MLFTPRNTTPSHSARNPEDTFFKSRVQTKLAIGKPGDKYEVEADRTADKVVSRAKESGTQQGAAFFSSKPAVQPKRETIEQKELSQEETEQEIQEKPIAESITPLVQTSLLPEEAVQEKCSTCESAEPQQPVQTKCAECEKKEAVLTGDQPVQQKCDKCAAEESKHPIQTKCAECEKKQKETPAVGQPIQQKCDTCAAEEQAAIQTKNEGGSSNAAISGQLKSSKGSGSAMDKGTISEMNSGFGTDFSNVRIHTDNTAVQMNRQLGAQAFTNGSDIYFNSGKYNPSSESGKHLLAHELTHTVQQGAVSGIQPKEDTIQKADDPCAPPQEQGSQSQARSNESTQNNPSCRVSNPPAEQPAEGQSRPSGEDRPREINSTEGSPLGERQANAPSPGENAPPQEQGIQQNAQQGSQQQLDPCALREQAASGNAQQGAGSGNAASTNAAAPANTAQAGLSTQQAANTGGATQQATPNQTREGEGNEANPETATTQNGDFFAQRAAQGMSPLIQAQGLGEEASPELQEERDSTMLNAAGAQSALETTKNAAIGLVSSGTNYQLQQNASTKQRHDRDNANARTNAFMQSGSAHIVNLIMNGQVLAEGIRSEIENSKQLLFAEIDNKRQGVSAFFSRSRAEIETKATLSTAQIQAQFAAVIMQIETQALQATLLIDQSHQTKSQELQLAYGASVLSLLNAYSTGYRNIITAGNTKGSAVETIANEHEAAYRRAEGASDTIRNRVVRHEADGFWDGYLSYNRYMARANAAKEVGKQYKDGMISQARSQADRMMCGQVQDNQMLASINQQGVSTLECAKLNARDAIERQKTAAVMQATHTMQEMVRSLNNSKQATLNQLQEKEAIQLQLINDYGVRQIMAIERDGQHSITTALQGVNTATAHLLTYLQTYQSTVRGSQAPDASAFQMAHQQAESQFTAGASQAEQAITRAIDAGTMAVRQGGAQVLSALQQLYDQGLADGRMLVTTASSSMDTLLTSAMTIFGQIQTTALLSITGERQNGVNTLTGIVTGISGLFTRINTSTEGKFREAKENMERGMQSTIDRDLRTKICNEAEKAAADVQPWWKTALKILLVIVVIVVVALVIGPAVIGAVGAAATALAGSLGAGAALAGTIGAWVGPIIGGAIVGALSGAVIQVGNNLIDIAGTNRPLSWENVTRGVVGAMVAGAIGGALGGFGGQFAQVLLGRIGPTAMSAGWRFVADMGINMAFDFVGSILGDLGSCAADAATCHPFSWESLLVGMAIGGVVQVSMGGLSSMARPHGNTPHVDATPGASTTPRSRLRSRVEDFATRVTDIQQRWTERGQAFGNRAGFGANAPDVATTRTNINNANQRMQNGEFLPTRDPAPTRQQQPNAESHPNVNNRTHPDESQDPHTRTNNQHPEENPNAPHANNREVMDPNHAPENNVISHQQVQAEKDWVQANLGRSRPSSHPGYTEEVQLPNGHTWRKNERGSWCRFSVNPLLVNLPVEQFTHNLNLFDARNNVIIPGNQIHLELARLEYNLRQQYQQSTNASTQNRNILTTRAGFVVREGNTPNMHYLLFDQRNFQSGSGYRAGMTARIPEMNGVMGAGHFINPTVTRDNLYPHLTNRSGFLGIENNQTNRGGVNVTGSTDFHSERAFYQWVRTNTDAFPAAIQRLGIKNPILLSTVLDMASTRYVCPICAVSGLNLVTNTADQSLMRNLQRSFSQYMEVDSGMNIKLRASAEVLFPANKVMPPVSEFANILTMHSNTPRVDFPVGQMDYALLRLSIALRENNQAEVKRLMNRMASHNVGFAQDLILRHQSGQLTLTEQNSRILTPTFCTL